MLKLSLPLRRMLPHEWIRHPSSLGSQSLVSPLGLCMILYWLIF